MTAELTIENSMIAAGLTKLQELAGSTAAAKGFHDDRPDWSDSPSSDGHAAALANWQGNKLLLIVSEVVEAHDEIRTGHAADETYYQDVGGVVGPPGDLLRVQGYRTGEGGERLPRFKPEGVPSEIADAVIRCFDFAYTEGFSLADIIIEKLAYNATRERLHGKKF